MNTLNRRDAFRLAGLSALGAAVAACAPDAASGGGAPKGDAAAKTFGFTSWSLNEEAQKGAVQAIVDAYAAARQVKIETASFPYNEYLNQVTLKLRGGQVGGAIQLDISWLAALAAVGRLKDLGAQAAKGGYTDVALSSGTFGGKQLGLPWTTGSIGLVANTEILKKAGVEELPATVEEFEAALRAVAELGGGITPYAAATKAAQLKDILPWMRTFGSPLLDGETITVGDDASVAAVEWYKKLYDARLIAPDVDRFDARALFAQGKAAFYDDAIITRGVVAAQSPDKSLAEKMAPLARPVLKSGDTPQALLWGHVIVVVEGEGSDAAADFAAYATSDTATVAGFFEKVKLPPTTTAGLADPKVAGDAFTTAWTEKITKTATANPFWRYAGYAQIETAIAEQVQAVLVGRASAKDALAKAAETARPLQK
ncbi:extracellular solute-binding protein [Actinomadura sp. ATCC 31491]|uniref:Extracellular solute-binding protein n=1 Tax=Actinomadura luzonensis TaxID=2805427 RepID=A0ABT0FPI6_9ACTN|nr:extracellular solute-binding protein [Actinomadura luzonensis]MCK2213823.1 extracellular solute-binding protein [Actinomadura luzonensis]